MLQQSKRILRLDAGSLDSKNNVRPQLAAISTLDTDTPASYAAAPPVTRPAQAIPKRQFIQPQALATFDQPPRLAAPGLVDEPRPVLTLRQFARLPFAPVAPEATATAPDPPAPVPPTPPVPTSKKPRKLWRNPTQKPGKKKRRRRLFIVFSLLMLMIAVFFSQANGQGGAWTADTLRAIFGPTITARIESWYLGVSDTTHQIQYDLSGHHVDPPWAVNFTPPSPIHRPTWATLSPMPLKRIPALVAPAIAGEGTWYTQGTAPYPYNYLPIDAKTFIRPDPSHPYAIVTLLQFDMRFINLHIVAGITEPGGPRGLRGPGYIPAADQKGNALLAAFNGGFKYVDGQYGLYINGITYVPPQHGVATIAVLKNGTIIMGAWGIDPRLNSANSNLVAWRQNAALLIDKGVINPLTSDGYAWGGTILNSAYTWRSGLGITAQGTLIYAAGDALTALTLGKALRAAGAVTAMQTDINPYWVRAFLYSRNAQGLLTIVKLNPSMQGSGWEYLNGTERDFFYLMRYAPPPPPQPPHARETYSQ